METYYGAITFPDLEGAHNFEKTLKHMDKEELIVLEDAVIVTKNEKGKVHVHQSKDLTTAKGAAKLGTVGFVAGLLLGGPVGGAVLGAAAGALLGKKLDLGIPDDKIDMLKDSLEKDHSLLFIQVRPLKEGALRNALKQSGGDVHDVDIANETILEVHDHLGRGGMNQASH